MKRILLTGAGGFIGRHTLDAILARPNWEVHAVVRGARAYDFPPEAIVHAADLSDDGDCEELIATVKPDVLIHLAWELGGKGYQQSAKNLIWVENSLRLMRLFFQYGGKRFIFAGTGAEYYQNGGLCREQASEPMRTLYGESKRSFELLAKNYCGANGYEFVSARIFSVYGEHDNRKNPSSLLSAIKSFRIGKVFTCMTPNNVWDFVHVSDVAGALVQIAGSEYCGTVNLATGRPHLVREVFGWIAQEMNCEHLLRFEENESAVIQVADTSLLNKEIGYTCKVELRDGLRRMVKWAKEAEFD